MAIAGVEVAAPETSFTRDTPEVAVTTEPASTLWATSPRTGAMTGEPIPSTTQMAARSICENNIGAGDSLAFAASWERGLLANETP